MKALGPSPDRGEMSMAGLRLLLLLHWVLYVRCCPFPSRTVFVNLRAPRTFAGCLVRAGGRARSKRTAPGWAKSQDAVAGVFSSDDNRVPLGKRGKRQR